MKTANLEVGVANHFDCRRNLIIPNVSWGFGLNYEADIIVVRPSGYAIEVEIKNSERDIKADKKKKKWRNGKWPCRYFKEFWMAVPEKLEKSKYIPSHAGILRIYKYRNKYYGKVIKKPEINNNSVKLNKNQIEKLKRLLCLRIWKIKKDESQKG